MAMVGRQRSDDDDDRDAWLRAAGITPPPRGVDLPYDDGEPMESERHKHQMDLLQYSLKDGWTGERPIYVAANMAFYFSVIQAKNQDFRAPDVFVVLDPEPKEPRLSWVVWEEDGQIPDVVIELLSASTEKNDRGIKKDVYERLGVPAYFVYDPFTSVLEGWSWDPASLRYLPLEKDERGHLFCAPLGLWLGVVESTFAGVTAPYLRWLDANRTPLKTRAESEAQRADAEAQRADAEAQRADAEAQRAEALSARIAEYERRFGRLPDEPGR